MNEAIVEQTHWRRNKKLQLTVDAPDGSKVWLNLQGAVCFQVKSGYSICFSALLEDGSELHDGKDGPPLKDKVIQIIMRDICVWCDKDGYVTDERVRDDLKQTILNNIKNGMSALGYVIKYVQKT